MHPAPARAKPQVVAVCRMRISEDFRYGYVKARAPSTEGARFGAMGLFSRPILSHAATCALFSVQKRAGLAIPEGGILAARRREVGVSAIFDNLAVGKHDDAVERGDR